jgi:hypothetical protein
MHLSVVARRLLPGATQVVTAADNFDVPGNGKCYLRPNRPINNLSCLYPFEGPKPTTIAGLVTKSPCGSSGPTYPGIAMLGSFSPGTRPDPLITLGPDLGGTVCPGTRLTFVTYHPADRFRLELDIPSTSLDQYVEH